MNERKWIDIEPSESTLAAYEVSKKVVNLLRQCQTIQRENEGAVQFWRIMFYLQNQFPQISGLSDDRWKACLAAGRGAKGDISIALLIREQSFTFVLFRDTLDAILLILRHGTDPRDKDHEDPSHIDFSVPHRAKYVQSAWKRHQDTVFWVVILQFERD